MDVALQDFFFVYIRSETPSLRLVSEILIYTMYLEIMYL